MHYTLFLRTEELRARVAGLEPEEVVVVGHDEVDPFFAPCFGHDHVLQVVEDRRDVALRCEICHGLPDPFRQRYLKISLGEC